MAAMRRFDTDERVCLGGRAMFGEDGTGEHGMLFSCGICPGFCVHNSEAVL